MRRNDPHLPRAGVHIDRSKKNSKQARLNIESLELRTLMTANAVLSAGLLSVTGGAGADDIDLLLDGGGNILVHDAGTIVSTFSSAMVSRIEIRAQDGNDTVDVNAAILQPATIIGGQGNDRLTGGGGPSLIRGRSENDVIRGGNAASRLTGDTGDDVIDGGSGNDTIRAGAGNDVASGNGGNDIINTNSGHDTLDGGAGADFLSGHAGNDVLTDLDGATNDTIVGGAGLDQRTYDIDTPTGVTNNTENVDIGLPNPSPALPFGLPPGSPTVALTDRLTLGAAEVDALLRRASAATPSTDAIIAVVDRQGHILGVRVESGVTTPDLVFAIDGAVALARTGAFFANENTPITSRTIHSLSETTMLQRMVDSNPNIPDLDSGLRGPGFVAEIGTNGHFPPDVMFTPQVDLFLIEGTNRDGSVHPGADLVRGTADDIVLSSRFNVDPQFVPLGQEIDPPDSYGFQSGANPNAQGRGIGTLPGGMPIFTVDSDGNQIIVGGIGVFFPGPDGFASFMQNYGGPGVQGINAPRVLEAEFIAFAALGGANASGFEVGDLAGIAPVAGTRLPVGRIDLVGLQLEVFGPGGLYLGPRALRDAGTTLRINAAPGTLVPTGANVPVLPGQVCTAAAPCTVSGEIMPEMLLVTPHAGSGLTADDVSQILVQAFEESNLVRAAIRLPSSSTTRMVLAVSDIEGNVLGLLRMPDATIFSVDVATSKGRNVAYYADPTQIQPIDRVDDNRDGIPDLPVGIAFTNRTFRFLALPFFPEGQDGLQSGAFSVFRDSIAGVNHDPVTLATIGAPLPARAFQSVSGFDAFNPGTNFHRGLGITDPALIANQSGIVFFPGSTPLYKDVNGDGIPDLVGGFGISGDGVDQDDVVTAFGAVGFAAPLDVRADQVFVRDIRLPFQKFLRNPEGLS